ncbi:hypothetical protein N9W79_02395 [bacterium]|nr:hypothetical protein [bacterium]
MVVEGSSLVGDSKLVVLDFDLESKRIVNSYKIKLENSHQGSPHFQMVGGRKFILNFSWLESEKTLAAYEITKNGILGPTYYGQYPTTANLSQVVTSDKGAAVIVSSGEKRKKDHRICQIELI